MFSLPLELPTAFAVLFYSSSFFLSAFLKKQNIYIPSFINLSHFFVALWKLRKPSYNIEMSAAPADNTNTNQGVGGAVPNSTVTPNWTIRVSDVKTIKVSNVSVTTTEKDIKEFFSFSGDIQYIEMQKVSESTMIAYVTFKGSQGADTAVLLTGSNIANVPVTITPVDNYQLPPDAIPFSPQTPRPAAVKKAEDVMSTMLAKGFILGKESINRAKSFDERHRLSSNASAAVASIDSKIGLSDKLSVGTAIVNEKVREMDEKYQVYEKTKSAIAVAEQKASSAGSVIMSNPYVSSGASWVSSAITAVAKAAEDVSTLTKEKVEMAEVDKKEIIYTDQKKEEAVDELAQVQYSDQPSAGNPPQVTVKSGDENNKLPII